MATVVGVLDWTRSPPSRTQRAVGRCGPRAPRRGTPSASSQASRTRRSRILLAVDAVAATVAGGARAQFAADPPPAAAARSRASPRTAGRDDHRLSAAGACSPRTPTPTSSRAARAACCRGARPGRRGPDRALGRRPAAASATARAVPLGRLAQHRGPAPGRGRGRVAGVRPPRPAGRPVRRRATPHAPRRPRRRRLRHERPQAPSRLRRSKTPRSRAAPPCRRLALGERGLWLDTRRRKARGGAPGVEVSVSEPDRPVDFVVTQ